jgi:hypothetical protein
VAGDADEACAREHVCERQLGYRVGACARGVADSNAVCLGVIHVDVVYAYTAADDELQFGSFRGVDDGNAHLGGGAHYEHVEITHLRCKLFRRIKLLHDLVTHFLKREHARFIHSVSC